MREQIAQDLANADGAVRARGAARIALDDEGLVELRDLLAHDPAPEVRVASASRLAFADDVGSAVGLLEATRDPEPTVVIAALDSLTFVGDSSLVPELQPLLEHPNPQVREEAAEAIVFLK